jgi:hypothetical protein
MRAVSESNPQSNSDIVLATLVEPRKRRRFFLAFWLIGFVIFLAVAQWLVCRSDGWRFSQGYRQLQIGMNRDQVEDLLGRGSVFECRYKSYEVCYYMVPDPFTPDTKRFDRVRIRRGASVQSLDELPDVYGHVQVAFDANCRLHAYTWIGGRHTVETKNRSVKGNHFSRLRPSDF